MDTEAFVTYINNNLLNSQPKLKGKFALKSGFIAQEFPIIALK